MKPRMLSAVPSPPLPLWLRAAAIYLFLPVIVFLIGWLNPWISIPLLLCTSASVISMVRDVSSNSQRRPSASAIRSAAGIGVLALAFALLTGLSDGLPQSSDYLKHSLLAGDLVERDWPVRYPSGQDDLYLC